ESRPGHRALVDGELLPQGEVLEGELAMPAEEEGEKPKQLEQECNHRADILSGSEARTQPLGRRTRFWRGTGLPDQSLTGRTEFWRRTGKRRSLLARCGQPGPCHAVEQDLQILGSAENVDLLEPRQGLARLWRSAVGDPPPEEIQVSL